MTNNMRSYSDFLRSYSDEELLDLAAAQKAIRENRLRMGLALGARDEARRKAVLRAVRRRGIA